MKVRQLFITLITLCTLSNLQVHAQMGMGGGMKGGGGRGGMRGGQQGGRPQGERPSTPKNLLEASGMFIYNAEDIIKACKIKDKTNISAIQQIVSTQEKAYNNTTLLEFDNINKIKEIEAQMKSANGGQALMMQHIQDIRSASQGIREAMAPAHEELNRAIVELLHEKELKKWRRYIQEFYTAKSYRPQRPNRPSSNNMPQHNHPHQMGK